MLPVRAVLALAALLPLAGCRTRTTAPSDATLAAALTDLATERKILKMELALARKEGDAMRATIDRAGTLSSSEVAAQLNATARELAALRVSYAKLQAERTTGGGGTPAQFSAIEEKLAATLRNYTQLQDENARLRADVQRARAENATLSEQLRTAVAHHDEAQSALAQLNIELLAQKEARVRADQAANAARAQLTAVMAASAAPASSGETAGGVPAALRLAKTPPAESSATAELRTDPQRLRAAANAAAAPAAAPVRRHVVAAGDTLEKLAQKYYGAATRWREIYQANESQLSQGRALTVGMQLVIPPP